MSSEFLKGTYGFQFTVPEQLAMCSLFAIGGDEIKDIGYQWDGRLRSDGPLLLFQYTWDGEGIFELGSTTHRVGPGQAFMTEIPGDHRYYFPEGGTQWSFLFILMRPTLILPNWEESKKRLGETPYLSPTSRPIRLLQEMLEDASEGRITDSFTASSYVFQFISELCRWATIPKQDRREWPMKIRLAVEYIESNYDSMISLDQLSDELDLSKYHLLRVFSRVVGSSPSQYLNQVRIKQAIHLLRQTDWSIERIAETVGYSGGSYFIKVFRKITGRTPGSFRSEAGPLTYNHIYFD